MTQLELISFIPTTACYQIWHPKNFEVNESEDDIVTITSPNTYSNLTITSYHASQHVTEKTLLDFLQKSTADYLPQSEIKKSITDDRIWLEQEFKNDKAFWVWWALSKENSIVLVSINSDNILSEPDRQLFTFMVDKMEIYPA